MFDGKIFATIIAALVILVALFAGAGDGTQSVESFRNGTQPIGTGGLIQARAHNVSHVNGKPVYRTGRQHLGIRKDFALAACTPCTAPTTDRPRVAERFTTVQRPQATSEDFILEAGAVSAPKKSREEHILGERFEHRDKVKEDYTKSTGSSDLPTEDMCGCNLADATSSNIVYSGSMFKTTRSRLQAFGDPFRGDIPIISKKYTQCEKDWNFVPAAGPESLRRGYFSNTVDIDSIERTTSVDPPTVGPGDRV